MTTEQWSAVDEAITQLNTALEPILVALATDQRKRLVKMGDGSEAFVRKSLDVFAENLDLLPRNFDLEEMRRDVASHDALHTRAVRLTQTMEKIHHTDTALGSDAMMAALRGYQFLKSARGEGVDALRQLLGERFEGNGTRPDAPPSPPQKPSPVEN
ncbi:hypothetical protein H4F99_00465 [Lysobacter sp. SG-8]|uniref:Uncharacterized protein n=2 Tax=Marilutibacter penaei TaxID=2759900 RepID=A0A7W3YCQ7_9GAMM|nr:hypothetical protein [Lysobacter penaei]